MGAPEGRREGVCGVYCCFYFLGVRVSSVRVLGGGARLLQLILSVSSNVYLYLMFYFISRCLSHITYIHIEEVWRGMAVGERCCIFFLPGDG